MLTITLQFSSFAEAIKTLEKLDNVPAGRMILREVHAQTPPPVVKAPVVEALEPVVESPPALVDRDEVSKAIVKLATKDKARAIEILAKFGAKAGRELKDENLSECFALVNEALSA